MKARINGEEFGYEILGECGIPIVLIHGFGLNRKIWLPMVSEYLGEHRVILPDVRGHGESGAPEGPYLMDLLAEDMVNLLAFLGIEKAILCGHSMGGYITLAFAEAYPERLAGMGLITTRAEADKEEERTARLEMIKAVRNNGAAALADSLAPRLTTDQSLVQEMHTILAKTAPEGIIGSLQGMAKRPDSTDFLCEISHPVLVIAGGEDQIIVIKHAKQMAEEFKDGAFLLIPKAGHLPMLEAPEELAKGLLTLVRKLKTK
jgi:3-oxoadipate enol-lactonase